MRELSGGGKKKRKEIAVAAREAAKNNVLSCRGSFRLVVVVVINFGTPEIAMSRQTGRVQGGGAASHLGTPVMKNDQERKSKWER